MNADISSEALAGDAHAGDAAARLDTSELRRLANDAARRWVTDGETPSNVAQYAHYLDELVTRTTPVRHPAG